MKLILLFFSVFTATYADEPLKNYRLPVNKMNLLPCYTNVSALHNGPLEKQWLIHDNDHFFIQYETQDISNKVWLTLCDLDHGVILKDETINGGTK